MSAIFNVLKEVGKTALPILWNLGKPLIDTGINAVTKMDMAGVPGQELYSGLESSGFNARYMDDPISEKDRKQEEVLVVTHADITKRQLLAFAQEQMKVEEYSFQMPVTGLVRSSVVLSFHSEYTFSQEATNLKIKNVNFNDHVYFHMMPKNFAFYDLLKKHDLFKFRNLYVKSASTSGFDTTTMLGFLPVTTDTTECTNGLLMQLCKKLETKAEEEVSYNIRYASPDFVTYTTDENKDLKNIKSKYAFLQANEILKTDNVIAEEEDENTALSYGTIVIVKQNVGQIVGMSFTINMEFDVWDYVVNGIKLSEIKDKNINGIPDDQEGSGSGKPNGSSRPGRIGRRAQN